MNYFETGGKRGCFFCRDHNFLMVHSTGKRSNEIFIHAHGISSWCTGAVGVNYDLITENFTFASVAENFSSLIKDGDFKLPKLFAACHGEVSFENIFHYDHHGIFAQVKNPEFLIVSGVSESIFVSKNRMSRTVASFDMEIDEDVMYRQICRTTDFFSIAAAMANIYQSQP